VPLDASPRPPLAKVRAAPPVRERHVALVSALEGRLRDLLALADVVSEGGARVEGHGGVYYGSTHLLLTPVSRGGPFADADVAALARVAAADPHLRVRALRVARGEALVRAGAALGPMQAELVIEHSARGLAIRIDLSAMILESGARRRSPTVK
jgi:hypothetical protein